MTRNVLAVLLMYFVISVGNLSAVYPSVDEHGNAVLRADEDLHIICRIDPIPGYEGVGRSEAEIQADLRHSAVKERKVHAGRKEKKNIKRAKKNISKVPADRADSENALEAESDVSENWLIHHYRAHPAVTIAAGCGIVITIGMLTDLAVRGKKSYLYRIYEKILATKSAV